MKTSLTVLVLILLLSILAGCAPGPNPSRKMASEHGEFAGFWLGLWQGFIAPFVFVASLFKGDLNVYEVHNNGSWYFQIAFYLRRQPAGTNPVDGWAG